MLKYIVKHDKSTETTKGFALTALMKIWHKYQSQNIDKDSKIMDILEQFRDDKQIEVQQRSVEFVSLFGCTDGDARKKILKAMPVPKIERLFDERTKAEKKTDSDTDPGNDTDTTSTDTDTEPGTEEEPSSGSESSSSETEKSSSEDSLASDSDDSKNTRRRKRKARKKRDKEKAKMAKKKEEEKQKKRAERKKKKKKSEVEVVVPRLSGPDDVEQTNGGVDAFDTPTKPNGGAHGNAMTNGGQQRQPPPTQDVGLGNLLDFPPAAPQPAAAPPSNNNNNNNNNGGGMDFMLDLLDGPSQPQQ